MNKVAKNIRFLRIQKGLTQEQFALELDITRSRVGSYEEGRSAPSIDMLIILSRYFNLPIDVIVKNDLTLSNNKSFIELGNHRVLFPISVDMNEEDLIEVIPIKASAGYLNGYADPEYIEQLEKIKLPFVPTGKHRAFPIKGDSMLPLKEGSYVVGKYLEGVHEIKNGKTYILLTKYDGMVYKRVYNNLEEKGTLTLVSDNKAYDPYDVKGEEILEIWEFTCSIQTQEYSEEELKIESILRMFRELQVELKSIRRW
ncbi:LexA family transcriptional regulator [bacterium SCSIO 12741]|nr:LexA family transcriptional regulator [bacterium SCSIO 12741]